jgi:hypothetical protein
MTRDEKGKFVKGNPGGGRKPRQVEKDYLAIFRSSVTPDDWRAIIEKAVTDAKRGDATARKFIADYMIGAPTQRTELTGEDGKAIKIKVSLNGGV